MTVLLKIYDDFASNKGVSTGVNIASTAFMAYRTFKFMQRINPTTFVISACVGFVFALIANSFLAYNDKVKNESQRNSVYATLSLLTAFTTVQNSNIYLTFKDIVSQLLIPFSHDFSNHGFLNGLGLGFTATILAIQLLEGLKTKTKK